MKNLFDKMNKLGYSAKKEISKFFIIEAVVVVIAVLAFVLLNEITITIVGSIFALVFGFLYFSRYTNKIEQINKKNIEDFSNLFSYFRIYIHNGFSVYSALKEIMLFASPELRELLEILIRDIDNDKTVQPFVKFARNFNEIIVEEMMISIYQMIDDGEQSEYLQQFELIFDKFSEVMYQKSLRSKDSKLGTLSSAPLVGSCFLIIALTIGIMSVIGGMINGL